MAIAHVITSLENGGAQSMLHQLAAVKERAGFMLGDLTKGGREATASEIERLIGW